VFSATYIAHELEIGRLTPAYLRFYHAMYQIMMFGMNLALVANNIGLMWVAIELRLSPRSSWSASTARMRRWRRRGNISSSAASASPLRYSHDPRLMAAQPVVGEGLPAWSGRC